MPATKLKIIFSALIVAAAMAPVVCSAQANDPDAPGAHARMTRGKLSDVQATPELKWQLPAGVDKSYGSIDANRMMDLVREQVAISDKSRDEGNAYWGRIAGQKSGVETQQWVTQKFGELGLKVDTVTVPMPVQELPKSFHVTVSGAGQPFSLPSLFPIIDFPAYMPSNQGSEDLDAVWVGLGQPVDFSDKDVRGKAVFIYSIPTPSTLVQSADWMDAVGQAQRAGAKAIFVGLAIPGNMKYVSHLTFEPLSRSIKVPIFTLGNDDVMKVAALAAEAGKSFKVHVDWDVQEIPGLSDGVVIGSLPGMSDEKIVMIAHTDGLFEGATDDGVGVAALLETARYFAALPKEKRRRTMYFVALPDHHESNGAGNWMHQNFQKMFPKTALVLNAEHVAARAPVYDRPWYQHVAPSLIPTNGIGPSWWGVYGSDRLAHIISDDYALFGVPTQIAEGGSPGELATMQFDAPSFYLHNKGVYYHTDADSPDIVPPEGMRNAVQAFCKIFNDVNLVDMRDLQPPEASRPVPVAARKSD